MPTKVECAAALRELLRTPASPAGQRALARAVDRIADVCRNEAESGEGPHAEDVPALVK